MSTQLDNWSLLEGKTLLHIEAPNGATILSMPKKRRAEAELIQRLPGLLNALFAWRSAQVHEGAVCLGVREGNLEQAIQERCDRERRLMMMADELHKQAIFQP